MASLKEDQLEPQKNTEYRSSIGSCMILKNDGLLKRFSSSLRTRFIITLLILLTASLYGQLTISKHIANSELDIEILNIAGRQRMLIELIAKEAFRIDEVLESQMWDSMDQYISHTDQASDELHTGHAQIRDYLQRNINRFGEEHTLYSQIQAIQPKIDSYLETATRVHDFAEARNESKLTEQLQSITKSEYEILEDLDSFMIELTKNSIDKNQNTRSIGWAMFALMGIAGIGTLVLVVEPGIRAYRKVLLQSNDYAKRAELSEQLLSIQQRATNLAAIVLNTDLNGTITMVNDRMCEFTGYTREELVGANPRIMNSGHHSAEFFQELYETIQGGNIWRGEICDRRKDGSIFWADTTIVPMLDSNGEIFRYYSLRIDVTRQKEAEHELHTILDALPSIVLYKDESNKILRLNKHASDTIGLDPNEIIGNKSSQFLTNQDPISSYEDDLEVMVSGEAKMGVIDSFISPSGQHSTMRIDKIPMLDIGGYFSRLVTIATDITEIVEIEQRLAMAIDAAQAGVWDWDISSGMLHTNDRYFTMLGDKAVPNPIPADYYHNRIHPDDRAEFLGCIQSAMEANEGSFESEFRLLCNAENYRWIRWTGKVIESNPDGTAKRIIGQHLDIDPAKRLDLAIRTALELKSESSEEETLTNLCAALADATQTQFAGVTRLVEQDGKQSALLVAGSNNGQPVNPFEYDLAGTPCNQVVNNNFCYYPDGVVEKFPDDHMLAEMQACGYAGLKLTDSKGDDIGLLMVVDSKPLSSPVDPMTALKLFAARVTVELEHNASQERLREAAELAESLSRSKSDFLANMSHEIRTPMTAILGFAELLEEDGDSLLAPQRRTEAIHTIRNNGQHLLTIINDILDISKIEAGKMTSELLDIHPLDIIHHIDSMMSERIRGKGLDFNIEFGTQIPSTIQSDPTRLRQVLLNLVGNAAKFTETGSITLRSSLTNAPNPQLQFEVIDTGIGLTEDQCKSIFEAFTQADTSTTRRFGGTGLGLNITSSIIQMLGGKISVESEPGFGSCFRISIDPGNIDNKTNIGAEEYAQRISRPVALAETPESLKQDTLSGRRILLVEDGPDNQRLISFHLGKAGAQIEIAENGRIAIDMLTAQDSSYYDLVLMDMQMPVLDGYSASTEIRQRGMKIPIIALTAHAMSGDRDKCLKAGCTSYQTKPIDKISLINDCASQITKAQQIRPPNQEAA